MQLSGLTEVLSFWHVIDALSESDKVLMLIKQYILVLSVTVVYDMVAPAKNSWAVNQSTCVGDVTMLLVARLIRFGCNCCVSVVQSVCICCASTLGVTSPTSAVALGKSATYSLSIVMFHTYCSRHGSCLLCYAAEYNYLPVLLCCSVTIEEVWLCAALRCAQKNVRA